MADTAEGTNRAQQFDDVIHGRMRLGVMAYLSGANPATFNELAEALQATNGNLSTHLRKLEDAGYVRLEKTYAGRRPLTRVHMTAKGRKAWRGYLDDLRGFLGAVDG